MVYPPVVLDEFTPLVIDVRKAYGTPQEQEEFLDEFREMLTSPGFGLLIGTGFEEGARRDRLVTLDEHMDEFFGWEGGRKNALRVEGVHGEIGYTGFMEDRQKDLAEQLQFCPGVSPYRENVFPQLVGFRENTMAVHSDLAALADVVCRAFVQSLGRPSNYFEQLCNGSVPNDVLRLAYYPALTAQQVETAQREGVYRVSPHADSCLITLIPLPYHKNQKKKNRLLVDTSGAAELGANQIDEVERQYRTLKISEWGILVNTGYQARWITDGVKNPAVHCLPVPTDSVVYGTARKRSPFFRALPKGAPIVREPICWNTGELRGNVFRPGDAYAVQMRDVDSHRANVAEK
jgi:hypothetical protein